MARRQPRRRLLERAAGDVDLVLGARMIVVDEGAAPRPDGDEARLVEIAKRLADRRLARAELFGELQFDQPLARPVVAADDPLDQRIPDAHADRLMAEVGLEALVALR